MAIKSSIENDVIIIEPELNRLDVQSVPAFKDAVTELFKPGSNVILDLHGVQFIDSTGLGALLSALRQIKENDGSMVLACVGEQALAMFRLVKMNRIFDIYPGKGEALRALEK
jgi:anti-sigma B factor antagonist